MILAFAFGDLILRQERNSGLATVCRNKVEGLFSMAEIWTYTLYPGDSLNNRDQTEISSAVLEPTSLSVFGIALVGLGTLLRRRQRR